MTRGAQHGEPRRQPAENDLHLDLNLHPPGSTLTWTSGGWGPVLRYVTRLLFVTLLLSCVLVLVASVLLLAHCRGRVREVEEAVGAVALPGQCSPLPLPAYFVCLVVVVTVFGFGCVGRKVTGLLLCVVSIVAMIIAVIVVVNQDCQQGGDSEAERVQRALAVRLQDCGLYMVANNSDSIPVLPSSDLTRQRFQFFADNQACTHTAITVRRLCHLQPFQQPSSLHGLAHHPILPGRGKDQHTALSEGVIGQSIVRVDKTHALVHADESKMERKLGEPSLRTEVTQPELTMNQTEVETCAMGVSRALHALCLQDTEVAFPFLLTLPVFYALLGLALIFVKHADLKMKASDGNSSSSAKRCSVGTNTPRACGASERGPRRALSSCLSSICLRHGLCLTCLLGGRRRCACCPTPSPNSRPSSRLRRGREGERVEEEEEDEVDEERAHEAEGGGREEVSLRVLRTSSPPEPHEELRLIDECV